METDTPLSLAEEAEALLLAETKPFQIFVRTVSGKTVVLNDITLDTPIATIREMAARKEGGPLPPAELRLVCGGKELVDGRTAGDFGIGKESTLHALLRLRGGYGEAAAVGFTLDRGIKRGNNADTIEETNGQSRAHKDWGRRMKRNHRLRSNILDVLAKNGIRGDREWYQKNWVHISSLIQQVSGGGNCGDFAQIVHSQLVATTKDQFVYQVVMGGGWDHQFNLTYPTKVAKLSQMDPDIATVADGWDNYMVIPLREVLSGTNCYGATIKNLDTCPQCGQTGARKCSKKDKDTDDGKCDNHFFIVATQECTGDGGLPSAVKDEIEGLISEELEAYKSSSSYEADLKRAREDDRGIFRFRVEDEVQDDRSYDDIKRKLDGLLKAKNFDLIKHEVAELSQKHLMKLFLSDSTWRDLVLTNDAVSSVTFPSLLELPDNFLLQALNLLSEPQFFAFYSAGDEYAARVLSIPYCAKRLYTAMALRGDSEIGDFMLDIDEDQVIAFYDGSPSAPAAIMASGVGRRRLFNVLTVADSATLVRIGEAMEDRMVLKFWLYSDETRAAIMGSATVREKLFAAMEAEPKTFLRAITIMQPAHIKAFAASKPSRREMIITEPRLKAILDS